MHFGVFAAVLTLEKLLERPLTACLHLNFVLVCTRHSLFFLLYSALVKKTKNTSFGCSVSHTRNIILKRCDHLKIFLND